MLLIAPATAGPARGTSGKAGISCGYGWSPRETACARAKHAVSHADAGACITAVTVDKTFVSYMRLEPRTRAVMRRARYPTALRGILYNDKLNNGLSKCTEFEINATVMYDCTRKVRFYCTILQYD